MSKKLMLGSVVGALFMALLALPVYAGMVGVSDQDLAGISGKDNSLTSLGTISQTSDGDNGSIVVGVLQWTDSHTADASDHKGANDISGDGSTVQQTVNAQVNMIQWGAVANASTLATDVTADFIDQESWGTMYLGGF
ncbi:MAG TPA: hypothetical protein VML36_05575 [Nitrospiria bacterium]|nr:hypothetical protein [Nitrospiria bacterium]